MNVREFEQCVRDIDGIALVIYAPSGTSVGKFDWQKKADQRMSVAEYMRVRVHSRVGHHEAAVIDGSGYVPHGGTHISRIRASYGDHAQAA